MRAMLVLAVMAMAATATREAAAAPVQRPVEWTSDGLTFKGTLVYDEAKLAAAKGKLPGVLVIHQWMGPTDYELMRGGMLADLGYVAFVGDVYGENVRPKDKKEAGAAAGKLKTDRDELRKRLRSNLERMLAQPEVDKAHVAAIGYCFGGTAVLELARSGADLAAVVTFHGGLDSPKPADGKNIKAKLLVLHGAADPTMKPADVDAFVAELEAAKVDWQKIDYGGAVHSFTQKAAGDDPSTGSAYNERADHRSWEAMKRFLGETLR